MKTGQVFSIPPVGFQEIANPVAMLNQRRSSVDNSDKFCKYFLGRNRHFTWLKIQKQLPTDLAFWGNDSYTFPFFLATQGKTLDYSTVQN